jgi:hypothetical protein
MEQLQGDLQLTQERIEQLLDARNRGSDLTSQESDRLEGELEQLRISQHTAQQRLQILQSRESELLVMARAAGQVAAWDLANRLLNKPVEAGELLLTTFQPEQRWNLELAIPDYRVGMVGEAIQQAQQREPRSGALVRFALSSHPDQFFSARLVKLASQATPRSPGDSWEMSRVVLGQAELDADLLPLKQDGAIAHATIDCGQVPAIWLVVRDAWLAVRSRIQMFW